MSKTSFYQEIIRFDYHALILVQCILRKLVFAVCSIDIRLWTYDSLVFTQRPGILNFANIDTLHIQATK